MENMQSLTCWNTFNITSALSFLLSTFAPILIYISFTWAKEVSFLRVFLEVLHDDSTLPILSSSSERCEYPQQCIINRFPLINLRWFLQKRLCSTITRPRLNHAIAVKPYRKYDHIRPGCFLGDRTINRWILFFIAWHKQSHIRWLKLIEYPLMARDGSKFSTSLGEFHWNLSWSIRFVFHESSCSPITLTHSHIGWVIHNHLWNVCKFRQHSCRGQGGNLKWNILSRNISHVYQICSDSEKFFVFG